MLIKLLFVGCVTLVFLAIGVVPPRTRPGIDWSVTFLNVVTGGVLFGLRAALLVGLAWFIERSGGGVLDLAGLHRGLQALLVFLGLDLTRYWVHYADHRVPFLWRFHAVHHSSEHLNASSGLRMHAVDIVQLTLIPSVLFGVLVHVDEAVLGAVLLLGASFDAFEHANLAMDMRRPVNRAWNRLFNNPHFHSWHHTRDGVKKDGNYGQALTVWDRLFGTDVTEPLPPDLYGLEGDSALEESLLGLQLLRRRHGG